MNVGVQKGLRCSFDEGQNVVRVVRGENVVDDGSFDKDSLAPAKMEVIIYAIKVRRFPLILMIWMH